MSATIDCVSSPIWILFEKNLNNSAVRRNSFSQSGVKLPLPTDGTPCGPPSSGLSTMGALSSCTATGALSSVVTDFVSVRGACVMSSAPMTIRYSTKKSASWLIARSTWDRRTSKNITAASSTRRRTTQSAASYSWASDQLSATRRQCSGSAAVSPATFPLH